MTLLSRALAQKAEREAEKLARDEARKAVNFGVLCTPSKAIGRGVYTGSTAGAAPKGEKAKPGKRAPTKEEREWMDKIIAYGCIACILDGQEPRPTAVHHLLRGGRRMGHMHTIGLCDPGHHQGGQQLGLVSRHPDKAAFEAKYGSEDSLLARLRAELGAT